MGSAIYLLKCGFRSPRLSQPKKVVSVNPGHEESVVLTADDENGGTLVDNLTLADFVGADFTFRVLEGMDCPVKFCQTLEAILKGKGIGYYVQGQPLTSTPTRVETKPKYKCRFDFPEQIQIMRHLHPDCERVGRSEVLNQKDKVWRGKSRDAMQFEGPMSVWAGAFKVAIFVSCLSPRCYEVVRSIIASRRSHHLKANAEMFNKLTGFRNEQYLFLMLKKVDSGDLALSEMNKRIMEEKESARARERTEDTESEITRLKKEVKELRKINQDLRRQLEDCRCKDTAVLDEDQQEEASTGHNNSSIDIFTFNEEDVHVEEAKQRPVRKRAYTVSYKPESDEPMDDSFRDPDYDMQEDSEVSSSSDTSDLNKAFCLDNQPDTENAARLKLQVKNWNPRQTSEVTVPEQMPEQDNIEACVQEKNGQGSIINQLLVSPVALERVEEKREPMIKDDTKKEKEPASETEERSARKRRCPSLVYKEGQRVSAEFVNGGRKCDSYREWLPAIIVKVLSDGAMFQVKFTEDGCLRFVRKSQLKLED